MDYISQNIQDYTSSAQHNNLYIYSSAYCAKMKPFAVLEEKVKRYEGMLHKALGAFEAVPHEKSHLRKVSDDFSNMARSYYEDGMYFIKEGDMVNALVCFSYGHAWLDAGVKLGVFKAGDEALFTI